MPASSQGLLSDRNMSVSSAGRLGLGHISEEDHCLWKMNSASNVLQHQYQSLIVFALTSDPYGE